MFGAVLPVPERAWYESEQTLCVQFNCGVAQVSKYDDHDAMNPMNYALARADGGPFDATILEIDRWTDSLGVADPTRIRIRLSGVAVRRYEFALVTPSNIATLTGPDPYISPVTLAAEGVAPAIILPPAGQSGDGLQDLRNLIAPSQGQAAGTFVTSPTGDYVLATSPETLKKMVLRILTTTAGAFAHLPGWGAAPAVKGLGKPSELQRVARDSRTAIQTLPGVVRCSVTVEQSATGVLLIVASVKTRRFGTLTFPWSSRNETE